MKLVKTQSYFGLGGNVLAFLVLIFSTMSTYAQTNQLRQSLPQLIKQVQPSIVGIGLYTPLESKNPQLLGTGFVVGNGRYVVTNYHVVAKELETSIVQRYVALAGKGTQPQIYSLEIVGIDPVHDLAILSISSDLQPVKLASDTFIDEGSDIFFMGFPIGAVLGLFPATHQGIIAAVAPDINPARNANELTIQMLSRLKKPFMIYQLDATAYPGNSGSPVFNRETGEVIAVINKVFVSAGKEAALTNPSGISYAIPVKHLRKLAKDNDITL
ncbi:serine protease [Glaciecola sp. SC05]|uniref:S1 family peptidase n=1 Tax=Glaciecola sp. SC05 TaxID=1987355 RepID=UPI0035280151